jgi:hypothetical protein
MKKIWCVTTTHHIERHEGKRASKKMSGFNPRN